MSQRLPLQVFTSKLETADGARDFRVPSAVVELYSPGAGHRLLVRSPGSEEQLGKGSSHHRHWTGRGHVERYPRRCSKGAALSDCPQRVVPPMRVVHREWREADSARDE